MYSIGSIKTPYLRISRCHHSHRQLTWGMHALAGEGRVWTARRRRSGARGRREAYTVFVAPFCALHWPRLCNPHTIQRLGRRNAANNSDFTPSVAPSHIGLRRKPALARDGRGVAQHAHGVRTRAWKQWHRLFGRLHNGATATPCATVRCFHYKRGPWPILRISRKSALRGPRSTVRLSCTT